MVFADLGRTTNNELAPALQHYKLEEILSTFQCQAPLHKRKAPPY